MPQPVNTYVKTHHDIYNILNITLCFTQELLVTLFLITLELLFPPKIEIMTMGPTITVHKPLREDGGTPIVVTQT